MERVHLVFFNHKIIVVVGKKLVRLRHILIAEMKEVSYSFGSLIIFKKNNPNFDTNAPPFKVRGCKVILGGAFFNSGGCKQKIQNMSNLQELHRFSQ